MRDEARLKELFDSYDSDGSGEISEDELYSIVEELVHNKTSAMHIVNVSGAKIWTKLMNWTFEISPR